MHSPDRADPAGPADQADQTQQAHQAHQAHQAPDLDDAPLGDLVMHAARRLRAGWQDRLSPWGLSPHQSRALKVVGRQWASDPETRLRLSELAAQLRIAPRSATEVVDGLVERGLLERAPDATDRRAVNIVLTPAGQRVRAQLEASRSADAEALFSALSEPERESLAALLRKVLAQADPPAYPGA